MRVIGVDGWRGGWIGVELGVSRFRAAWIAASASELMERAADAAVIGVDIPIGLPASGTRACDRLARRLLGRRGSSVFSAPPRSVVQMEPYAAANAHCKASFGFGISRQSYALRNKVLEIDAIDDPRLHEVHPELAFLQMAGRALPSKKTWAGMTARRLALAAAGIVVPDELGEAGTVPVDDVLDAAAAAWTAGRIGRGEAISVPEAAERDDRGKPMAIWR